MAPWKSVLDCFYGTVAIGDDCWLFTGSRAGRGKEYGKLTSYGRTMQAHRAMYELLVGPIPEGLTIDHLCRVKLCVRPDHLEPVTMRENLLRADGLAGTNARKTHCPQGHPYSGENLFITATGGRACRICGRAGRAKYYFKRKAANRIDRGTDREAPLLTGGPATSQEKS